jgi:hypothetical protein
MMEPLEGDGVEVVGNVSLLFRLIIKFSVVEI